MATTAMDYENANGDRFDEEAPRYERDNRSASPRGDNGHDSARRRSASPAGNGDRDYSGPKDDGGSKGGDDDGAINPGSNLFVTGIHPRLTEQEVTRLFEKYGEVEKCQIMRDPHTKESRGFGFVKMVTSDQADAAKEGLQGEQIEGRTLSIEKARRARPRTPTPGKYFGPPKREGGGGGRGGGRFGGDRYGDDRRRGGYGGGYGGGRDDSYRYRNYDRRYEDRGGYDRGYRDDRGAGGSSGGYDRSYRDDRNSGYERRDRDDGGYSGSRGDRYGGGREDRGQRYGGGGRGEGGEDRRGGYERRYEDRGGDRDGGRSREPAAGPAAAGGYGESAPRGEAREAYGGA
ncbi:putative transformer-sr ribonucleo protein [Phaeoacremonium minimum UCRPA7]|uniref:Putative transformer-sr ribonucleo protein n=1 Tax=Phaeoacremonium minimum (strain UCR-PA7) TaxID=1286976 RepID=R8BU97_PHAM7|nr:putative transformer-sr ribonucleo protein [Phaeoacremonium minimum UCRPA7]EOO02952.1 putative transformer-sr ribonucleo protein [Phaeoacremonium minimum UCRPA7]